MALRTYIMRVIGDGVSLDTAYRSAMYDLFAVRDAPVQVGSSINGTDDPYYIATLEVDASQHAVLLASDQVRLVEGVLYEDPSSPPPDALKVGLTDLLVDLGEPVKDGRGTDWKSPA